MIRAFIVCVIALSIPTSAFCAEQDLPKDGKHLFILSGQSNMRSPLPDAFKESVTRVFGEDKVIVVTHAHPSQPIKRWYKKWTPPKGDGESKDEVYGTLYDALLQKVERAIEGQQLASVTYIWMQGEADAMNGWGEVYEQSFYGVLEQFKSDLDLKEINFVLGRINDHYLTSNGIKDGDVVRAVQAKIGDDSQNGVWVNTDDLNTGVNPWGIYETAGGHFPNPAYRVLGQRFARKACRLIDPKLKLEDSAFDAVFCDTADDVEAHLAIGKKISGTKPDAKRGEELELSSLLDGKYASADHEDKRWLAFSPREEGIELLVDLGEKQDVAGIGVDILIKKEAAVLFPKGMVISMSDDGTEYRKVHNRGITFFYNDRMRKNALSNLKPQSLLIFIETPNQSGQYIKIELETDKSSVFLDEIIVNPTVKSARLQNVD